VATLQYLRSIERADYPRQRHALCKRRLVALLASSLHDAHLGTRVSLQFAHLDAPFQINKLLKHTNAATTHVLTHPADQAPDHLGGNVDLCAQTHVVEEREAVLADALVDPELTLQIRARFEKQLHTHTSERTRTLYCWFSVPVMVTRRSLLGGAKCLACAGDPGPAPPVGGVAAGATPSCCCCCWSSPGFGDSMRMCAPDRRMICRMFEPLVPVERFQY